MNEFTKKLYEVLIEAGVPLKTREILQKAGLKSLQYREGEEILSKLISEGHIIITREFKLAVVTGK